MKNNTKKWLTVAGCLAVCVVLVIVIASSFSKDKVTETRFRPAAPSRAKWWWTQTAVPCLPQNPEMTRNREKM